MKAPRPRYEACELVVSHGGRIPRVVATAWTAAGAQRRARLRARGVVAIFDTLTRTWIS